eukprot:c52815_g1_i1.p2 GENE.c52815_g1_i1~~c52815_g1_i1.p2  ORF type:complete len:357 (+),score=48.69 c52815_g1_i1:96-1166(+)
MAATAAASMDSRRRFSSKNESNTGETSAAPREDYVSIDNWLQTQLARFAPGSVQLSDIVWFNVVFLVAMHIAALYGLWLAITVAKWGTIAFAIAMWPITGMGVTVGVHRLWSHRSYKAHWLLRTFLMIVNCAAYQGSIFEWARDHRVHHKCSETDGDPYNAARGMFFAHIGWVMVRKHPEVLAQGKKIDVSDLEADRVVAFQRKFYLPLVFLFCYGVPTAVCWYFFGESPVCALLVAGVLRHMYVLHCTWTVNSLAHCMSWGARPYSERIHPAENFLVSLGSVGEGWHNYHHMLAYDYSASEFGWSQQYNPSTLFIDSMAAVGLVWDRRKASPEVVAKLREEVIARGGVHGHAHSH